jgi:phage terminase large subunit-like protein
MAGLDLDPWQQFALHGALGERPDGKWAAFEVGIEVPRQNGKGGILEAFGLAGLFLLGEQLIIHSAHEFATAEEALERMAQILEASPDLSRA